MVEIDKRKAELKSQRLKKKPQKEFQKNLCSSPQSLPEF